MEIVESISVFKRKFKEQMFDLYTHVLLLPYSIDAVSIFCCLVFVLCVCCM